MNGIRISTVYFHISVFLLVVTLHSSCPWDDLYLLLSDKSERRACLTADGCLWAV